MAIKLYFRVLKGCYNPNKNYGLRASRLSQLNPVLSYKNIRRNILPDLSSAIVANSQSCHLNHSMNCAQLYKEGQMTLSSWQFMVIKSPSFCKISDFPKPWPLYSEPFSLFGKQMKIFVADRDLASFPEASILRTLGLVYGTYYKIFSEVTRVLLELNLPSWE